MGAGAGAYGPSLLTGVVQFARINGYLLAEAQDPRFATKAPMIRKSLVLTEDQTPRRRR